MSGSNKKEQSAGGTFRPPPPERRSQMVSLRLTPSQIQVLNELTQARGSNRADLIREALDFWLIHGWPGSKS